jgi:hypothetical protein
MWTKMSARALAPDASTLATILRETPESFPSEARLDLGSQNLQRASILVTAIEYQGVLEHDLVAHFRAELS